MKKQVKLSDYVVSFLENLGIKHVFMIVGGGAMHLNDSVGQSTKIKYICNHHEQASAIGAESYARITNNLGVCLVTSGPGGTNAITGLTVAWLDSIPVLFISGQVKKEISIYKYPHLRQLGFQEANIISIVKAITKYAQAVLSPHNIKYYLEKAICLAKQGRPGPVWLDIPLDVQAALIDPNKLRSFNKNAVIKKPNEIKLKKQVAKTISLLNKAQRPVIISGFGIRLAGAVGVFYKLIERLKIPILTPMAAHDLMWENHPLYAGRFGMCGSKGGNFTVQNSDLLLVLGARLSLWEVGHQYKYFARKALKIVVDIDKTEFHKPTVQVDLQINSDVKLFIQEMLNQLNKTEIFKRSLWLKKCKYWYKKYPVYLPRYSQQKKFVNSYYFTEVLAKLLKKDEIILTGSGTPIRSTSQSIKLKKDQRLLCNTGLATMGWGLPAAIGACFASNKSRVILIVGDGCIQMSIQELQTIVHHQLPIKIFILNNKGYMAIRATQGNIFKRYTGTDSKHGVSFPNMQKISAAYGISSTKIKTQNKLKQNLLKVINSNEPHVCEIVMSPNQPLVPRLMTVLRADGFLVSKPLEDTYPFLNRREFLSNMIIKPVDIK